MPSPVLNSDAELPPSSSGSSAPAVQSTISGLWTGWADCSGATQYAHPGTNRGITTPDRKQPLTLVLAHEGESVCGAGFTQWPAAWVTGTEDRVYFTLHGSCTNGSISIEMCWEPKEADVEHRVQLTGEFDSDLMVLRGEWLSGTQGSGSFEFTLRPNCPPVCAAGIWQGTDSSTWAICVQRDFPTLFGARLGPDNQLQRLTGTFDSEQMCVQMRVLANDVVWGPSAETCSGEEAPYETLAGKLWHDAESVGLELGCGSEDTFKLEFQTPV